MRRYVWKNGERTITVEAKDLIEAMPSFHDILAKYYPETTLPEWSLVV